jgi:ketosteroid isomerase-like protein
MKYFLISAFLFACTTINAQSKDEQAIRKVLEVQNNAWNRGDIEEFMEGYWKNDSLMFIGNSGITYGWTNTLNNYKKGYPDTATMGKLTFTLLHLTKLSKDYYRVIGKWLLKRSVGDVGGYFTLILRKVNGKWVIVSDHSS